MQQLLLHCKGIDKVVLISDSTVFDNPTPPEYAHVEDPNFDHNGDIASSKLAMDLGGKRILMLSVDHLGFMSVFPRFISAIA